MKRICRTISTWKVHNFNCEKKFFDSQKFFLMECNIWYHPPTGHIYVILLTLSTRVSAEDWDRSWCRGLHAWRQARGRQTWRVSVPSPHVTAPKILFFHALCRYIFDFFKSVNLTRATYGTLLDQLSKAISHLTTAQNSIHRNGNNIQKVVDAIKVI